MDTKTGRIPALNDELRQDLPSRIAVMTPGVAALGQTARAGKIPRATIIRCPFLSNGDIRLIMQFVE